MTCSMAAARPSPKQPVTFDVNEFSISMEYGSPCSCRDWATSEHVFHRHDAVARQKVGGTFNGASTEGNSEGGVLHRVFWHNHLRIIVRQSTYYQHLIHRPSRLTHTWTAVGALEMVTPILCRSELPFGNLLTPAPVHKVRFFSYWRDLTSARWQMLH